MTVVPGEGMVGAFFSTLTFLLPDVRVCFYVNGTTGFREDQMM